MGLLEGLQEFGGGFDGKIGGGFGPAACGLKKNTPRIRLRQAAPGSPTPRQERAR